MDIPAANAAYKFVGNLNYDMLQLVMMCLPPYASNTLTRTYPNDKLTWYNNESCGHVQAQMHEVGHNLGLGHILGIKKDPENSCISVM